MLNNNFSKLVKLYEKYQRQQRNRMLLKVLGLVVLAGAGYLTYDRLSTQTNRPEPVSVAAGNDTVTPAAAPASVTQKAPPETAPAPLKRTVVQTPKTEAMPKTLQKRTPPKTKKKPETFQLKVSQRESLYKLLVNYKDRKSYDAAIKIARFYLQEKDYNKAVKWAVEASKKDPSQEESWLIYARAKKALGKPEVAKRALSIYLKHNYSQPAQNLLDSL
ncbi:MAG TPA: hypothetical protein ENK97_03890 [Campylobacteraceae bacterium]|nr:hypothetical protein [Campylobacteraceae bacterium]